MPNRASAPPTTRRAGRGSPARPRAIASSIFSSVPCRCVTTGRSGRDSATASWSGVRWCRCSSRALRHGARTRASRCAHATAIRSPCSGETHGKARSGTPGRASNDGCIGNGASIGSSPRAHRATASSYRAGTMSTPAKHDSQRCPAPRPHPATHTPASRASRAPEAHATDTQPPAPSRHAGRRTGPSPPDLRRVPRGQRIRNVVTGSSPDHPPFGPPSPPTVLSTAACSIPRKGHSSCT